WQYGTVESVAGGTLYDESRSIADLTYEQIEEHDGTIVRHLLSDEANANGAHIARHDPARVLAECQAKRAIVEHILVQMRDEPTMTRGRAHRGLTPWAYTLRLFAAVYADHPDYQEEWRPT